MDNYPDDHFYRRILPANLPNTSTVPSGAKAASRNGFSDLPPKTRYVSLACNGCRKARIKCDGQRPTCQPCAGRGQQCSYEGGRSRHLATKSRLESLEKLVASLKISNEDETDRLLQGIRRGDSIADSLTSEDSGQFTSDKSSGYDDKGSPARSTASTSPGEAFRRGACFEKGHPTAETCLERQPQPQPPVLGNSFESIRRLMPEASVTWKAVEAFFKCGGKLFHVFNKEAIARSHEDVYGKRSDPGEKGKVAICFVMAVAAVGAQYVHECFSDDVERTFYDLARHCSEAVAEQQPLDSIKVCSLLALYNILEKDEVSLAYVESGLGMCRRYGLSCSSSRPKTFAEDEWIDYRKTWRTLMFFSSWLSVTLGYISGNDIMSERVSLSEVAIGDSSDLSEVVQTQMAKICLLNANMFRTQLTLKHLTVSAIESILGDLQEWHRALPDAMRLSRVGGDAFPEEAKRSISHVHLLYLGAIMLLYRRIASELARYRVPEARERVLPYALEGTVAKIAGEAALAARTSARLLKLLYDDDGIFKRCWLVIFQTYTSGVILLHSMAQRQLNCINPAITKEDEEAVQDILAVLSFCSSQDRVAGEFRAELSEIFDTILAQERGITAALDVDSWCDVDMDAEEYSGGTTGGAIRSLDGSPGQRDLGDFGYLLTLPADADPARVRTCVTLLKMLSRPFTDAFNPIPPDCEKTQGNEAADHEMDVSTRLSVGSGTDGNCELDGEAYLGIKSGIPSTCIWAQVY